MKERGRARERGLYIYLHLHITYLYRHHDPRHLQGGEIARRGGMYLHGDYPDWLLAYGGVFLLRGFIRCYDSRLPLQGA